MIIKSCVSKNAPRGCNLGPQVVPLTDKMRLGLVFRPYLKMSLAETVMIPIYACRRPLYYQILFFAKVKSSSVNLKKESRLTICSKYICTTLFSVDSESMHNKLIEHQIFTDYRCTNQGRRKV